LGIKYHLYIQISVKYNIIVLRRLFRLCVQRAWSIFSEFRWTQRRNNLRSMIIFCGYLSSCPIGNGM